MNDEIIKLARECGLCVGDVVKLDECMWHVSGEFLIDFYRAAYNKAIEHAASRVESWTAGGNAAHVIRALEMR